MRASLTPLVFVLLLLAACSSPGGDGTITVRVLHTKGCMHAEPTLKLVEVVAKELGIAINAEKVLVSGYDAVVENRFFGSPTVQVNGLDIEPAMRDKDDYSAT